MTPEFQLLSACFALSLLVAYAVWCGFRMWIFRQDLFQLRNRLWDRALAEGKLDEVEHRELRENINRTIRFAPFLGVTLLLYIWARHGKTLAGVQTSPGSVGSFAEEWHAYLHRISKYIFFETVSGLVVFLIAKMFNSKKQTAESFEESLICRVMKSAVVRGIADREVLSPG